MATGWTLSSRWEEMKEAREKLIQGLLISDGTYINVPLGNVVTLRIIWN